MQRIIKILAAVYLTGLLAGQVMAGALPEMSAENVKTWADALFAEAEKTKRFSGAVITFVQHGEITFSKGYGYADYLEGTPVDPATTTFRIGSITKTFTATAIAQLIDRGQIAGLDDAANLYLKRLQLPSPGDKDITLEQLITHSAGFENRVFNIATEKTVELPLSAEDIKAFTVDVVNEPGRYVSYNNYATTVLGLIVEDVTGTPIAEYFKQNIFIPLGMDNTVLNMSPDATEGLGVPYAFLPNGDPMPIPHRSIQQFYAPVGGANATALDIARFMIANLQAGEGVVNPLLSPALFALMHNRLAGNNELSSGFGMIYFIWDWNKEKLVLHGGDWPGTHSAMLLFPDRNAGIFFSLMAEYPEIPILEGIIGSDRTTSVEGVEVDGPISNFGMISDFLVHFLGPVEAPVDTGFVAGDPDEYVGNYVAQSVAHSGMDIMLNFVSPISTVRVRAAGDGGLLINNRGPYQEIAEGVFWNGSVQTGLGGLFLESPMFVFSRDVDGEVDYLSPQIGFDAWVKKGPLGVPSNYLGAWAFLLMFLLTGLLSLFYPRLPDNATARWIPPIIASLLVLMPMVLLLGYAEGDLLLNHLFFGRSGRFLSFAVLANLIAILALLSAWFTVKAWQEHYWAGRKFGIFMRLHYSLLSVAALLFIPVFSYSNLLII